VPSRNTKVDGVGELVGAGVNWLYAIVADAMLAPVIVPDAIFEPVMVPDAILDPVIVPEAIFDPVIVAAAISEPVTALALSKPPTAACTTPPAVKLDIVIPPVLPTFNRSTPAVTRDTEFVAGKYSPA
jgi:hypothetical protein